jgi:hypothetical protein
MQSLLRWSIENSTTSTTGTGSDAAAASPPIRSRTDLDPGIIDAILGRPDSELMKEALAKAQDASLDEDARITALDDLEMVEVSFPRTPPPLHNCCICVTAFVLMSDKTSIHSLPHRLISTSSSRTSIMQMVSARVPGIRCYKLINPSPTEDLENLGMWEPLQDLVASSSEDMKVQALWVIGTAVQNNPAAQKAVRSHHPS